MARMSPFISCGDAWRAARVITLHELDPEQTDFPVRNRTYNLADAVIVHDSLIKEKLVSAGVAANLVNVVCCGTDLAEGENVARDGIVFYGGHHLNRTRDLASCCKLIGALRIARQQCRDCGFMVTTGRRRRRMPSKWQSRPASPTTWNGSTICRTEVVRRGDGTSLPTVAGVRAALYGSFAGLAAGVAAANRLPIIATRLAGVPDHIGDLGIWISGNDPVELADRIEQVLSDEAMRQDYGTRLRAHAEQHLGWDTVARETLNIYESAAERAAKRLGCGTEKRPLSQTARGVLD